MDTGTPSEEEMRKAQEEREDFRNKMFLRFLTKNHPSLVDSLKQIDDIRSKFMLELDKMFFNKKTEPVKLIIGE